MSYEELSNDDPLVQEALKNCPWRDTDHVANPQSYCTWCEGFVTACIRGHLDEVMGPQTQLPDGRWVVAIPLPLRGFKKTCMCGSKFFTDEGYNAHYIYVHTYLEPTSSVRRRARIRATFPNGSDEESSAGAK